MIKERIIITERSLPTDRFILQGIDVGDGPFFRTGQVGSIFYGKSISWVKKQESEGIFYLDGENVAAQKVGKQRVYDLKTIEKMSHALASHGRISTRELINALLVVQAIARVWEYTD